MYWCVRNMIAVGSSGKATYLSAYAANERRCHLARAPEKAALAAAARLGFAGVGPKRSGGASVSSVRAKRRPDASASETPGPGRGSRHELADAIDARGTSKRTRRCP